MLCLYSEFYANVVESMTHEDILELDENIVSPKALEIISSWLDNIALMKD